MPVDPRLWLQPQALVAEEQLRASAADQNGGADVVDGVRSADENIARLDLESALDPRAVGNGLVLRRAKLAPCHRADLDDSPLVVAGRPCRAAERTTGLYGVEHVGEATVQSCGSVDLADPRRDVQAFEARACRS
jgi:hypothetical protein